MRMMMRVCLPVQASNKAIKDGSLATTMGQFVEKYKPEAAHFTTFNGRRTAFFTFNLDKVSDMPSIAEPFFVGLDAEVDLSPAMNLQELKEGLDKAMTGTPKGPPTAHA